MKRQYSRSTLVAQLLFGGALIALSLLASRRRARLSPLSGKVVVITGGSRGLGLALSEACLEANCHVAMLARDAEELNRGRNKLLGMGYPPTSLSVFQCDVTDAVQVAQTMALIESTLGPIEVLINNAGIISVGPVENQELQAFEESMQTNFFGALHGSLAVLPQMLKRGTGRIVNIASIGGLIAVPHLLPYSASKFALVGFSRGLSAELRSKGIQVLTVCPWLMRTGSHLQASFSGIRSKEYRWFSLGATLPVVSVSARDAAKRIIAAIENGEKELLISAWSGLASRIAHNAPAMTTWALALANRLLLPSETEMESAPMKGFKVRQNEWKSVRTIGDGLASQWNQEE